MLNKHIRDILDYIYSPEQSHFEEIYLNGADFEPHHVFSEQEKTHIFYSMHQALLGFNDNDGELESEHVIVISTAHLTQESANQDSTTYPWLTMDSYGSSIRVDPDFFPDLPADVVECLKYAARHSATILRFDCDGRTTSELPKYDW
jgi:hypothetical protein